MSNRDEPQTIVKHLEELRRRIIICVVSFLLVTGIFLLVPSFENSLATQISKHLQRQFLPVLQNKFLPFSVKLVFLDPIEPVFVLIKLSALTSLILLMPLFFYHIFAFVSPAFTLKKRIVLAWFLFGSVVFLAIGGFIAYFLLIPETFKILINYGMSSGAVPQLSIGKFFDFLLWMFLLFSLPFELPLVIGFLTYSGILSTGKLRAIRKSAYLVIAILSAMLTPDPTPFSMLILTASLILLYEFGILISVFFKQGD